MSPPRREQRKVYKNLDDDVAPLERPATASTELVDTAAAVDAFYSLEENDVEATPPSYDNTPQVKGT